MTGKGIRRRTLLGSVVLTGLATGLAGCGFLSGSDGGGGDRPQVGPGETHDGSIDRDDPYDPVFGDLAQPVTLAVEEPRVVDVRMEASFLTYLVVTDQQDRIVGEEDFTGGGSRAGDDSLITVPLTSAGEYTVWAGSASGSDTGEFSLSVTPVDMPDDPGDLRSIGVGESATGYLDAGDRRDPHEHGLAEPVSLEVDQGSAVRILMRSDAFDPFVIVNDPDGAELDRADEGGGDRNAQLDVDLESGGTFTIWAGSFSRDSVGPYSLRVSEQS